MNAVELAGLAELKQGARATWAAGDYPAIARRELWEVGARIARRVDVRPGEDVLDVACGTGNAALRAAQAGARVVGVDLTPELLEEGRRLAREANVEVDWAQGDAEALPGRRRELRRRALDLRLHVRPAPCGGRAGACPGAAPRRADGAHVLDAGWRDRADVRQPIGSLLPPPSPLAEPPVLWGVEDHVAELFEGTGLELEFERDSVQSPPFESTLAGVEFMTSKFGPLIMARQLTEASGRWPELHALLSDVVEKREPAEYLVILGRKEIRRAPIIRAGDRSALSSAGERDVS